MLKKIAIKDDTKRTIWNTINILDVSKKMRCWVEATFVKRNRQQKGNQKRNQNRNQYQRTVQSESLKLPPKSNCGEEKSISGYPRISISPATLNKVRHATATATATTKAKAKAKAMSSLVNINGCSSLWQNGGVAGGGKKRIEIKINKHKGHTWYADKKTRHGKARQACCLSGGAVGVVHCHWANNDNDNSNYNASPATCAI